MPEIELAVPGIELFSITLVTVIPFAHAQRFLLGVHGEVRGLIVVDRLLLEASQGGGMRNLLSRQFLGIGLSLHLLPQQRDVLDALQLAGISQESAKQKVINRSALKPLYSEYFFGW